MSPLRLGMVVILSFPLLSEPKCIQQRPGHVAVGSDESQKLRGYVAVDFDEHGKLADLDAWTTLKQDIASRAPTDVFLLAHGWLTSKKRADAEFNTLGKWLHAQKGKGEKIEVIGMRWPSLVGEGNSATDQAFKKAAALLSAKLGKSEHVKQHQAKLKAYLKSGTLSGTITRAALAELLNMQLPKDKELGLLIDNLHEPQNIEALLSACTYYRMRQMAEVVGVNGVRSCLGELQEALPRTRFHVVGHSFGCNLCLAALARGENQGKPVDSVTLLQGAVSMYCFTPKITHLDDAPGGAYVKIAKRVKGCLTVTFTKNDKALNVAYVAASQAAGQIGELADLRFWGGKTDAYRALGAHGIPDAPVLELSKTGTGYALRPGVNAFNADRIVRSHNDVWREEIAWLIWSTARYRP